MTQPNTPRHHGLPRDSGEKRAEPGATAAPDSSGSPGAAESAKAAKALPESEAHWAAVFEGILDAISILDNEGRRLDVNPAACLLYGVPKEELLGTSNLDFISPAQRGEARQLWEEAMERGELTGEYRIVRPSGESRDVEFTLTANFLPGHHLSVLRDITERKHAEGTVRRSEQQLFQFLEAVPVAIFVLSAEGKPFYANEAAKHLLGRGIAPEASTDQLADVYSAYITGTDQEYPAEQMPIVRALSGERAEVDNMEIRRPEKTIPLRVSATPIFDEHGRVLYAIAAFNDVSDRRQMETVLREMAARDDLTGLYNRRHMARILHEEEARCLRYNRFTSLVMLDIDRFKAINDTYGHPAGDDVLRQIAQLVREHVRAVDSPVRYGGEELAIILPETTDSSAFVVAERIRQAIASHLFTHGEHGKRLLPIRTTASVGIACLPTNATTVDALIAAADRALYEAKSSGRNRTVLFGMSR